MSKKVKQFELDSQNLGIMELSEGGLTLEEFIESFKDIFKGGVRINKANKASISFINEFESSFPANGKMTLIDNVPGYLDFSYNWLIWDGVDMDATIDFSDAQFLDSIEVSFLVDARLWVFPPREVRILISSDGNKFEEVFYDKFSEIDEDYSKQIKRIRVSINQRVTDVRVVAKPFVELPNWRYHHKKKPLITCDEIWIH